MKSRGPQSIPLDWSPPKPEGHEFRWAVGTSVLEEFVRSHTYLDILRELVQNEYDAQGRSMRIVFGRSDLTVWGSGKPIDAAGWRRLSVMLGIGQIAGTSEPIRAKVNGLGSKNFGLRALFLVGDTVYIRSNGHQTILDWREGALKAPLPDPASAGRLGVVISVPYRASRVGSLPSFDLRAEHQAFRSVNSELASTLLKLGRPSSRRSLANVEVEWERLDRHVKWTQRATPSRLVSGILLVRRTVRIEEKAAGSQASVTHIREMEFQRVLRPTRKIRPANLPGYFQHTGGGISIGLSIRLRNTRLDRGHAGTIYYPLEARHATTGCAVSVNAPFEMDNDRSLPLDPEVSPWNAWISKSAAEFATKLLVSDWYVRFGADAYLAWSEAGAGTASHMLGHVLALIKLEPVWPSREHEGKGRAVFKKGSQLAVPTAPILGRFLSPRHLLASRLSSQPRIIELAQRAGSRLFTLNSAIRLRCVGHDPAQLATKLDRAVEANYFYSDFPESLRSSKVQRDYSDAFDALSLSVDNIADLKTSPTTLTDSESLAAGGELWSLDPTLAGSDIVGPSQRLHSTLVQSRALATRVAQVFKPTNWLLVTVERVRSGKASQAEVRTVYDYVRTVPQLSRAAWSRLRRAPILPDSHGRWAAPNEVVLPSRWFPGAFAAAIHVAHSDYAKDSLLAEKLKLRRRLEGAQVVACARFVATKPELAPALEQLLNRNWHLLTKRVVAELSSIGFLRATGESLAAPRDLHIRNASNTAILGNTVIYTAGDDARLYRKLGCSERPTSDAIIASLEKLKAQGMPGPGSEAWELVYKSLIDGLIRERKSTRSFRREPILWTATGWVAPDQALVGTQHQRRFLDSVPVFLGLRGAIAYELGAWREPQLGHWRALFERVSQLHPEGGPILASQKSALRAAMAALDAPPADIAPGVRFLLDRNGYIHLLRDAATEKFLLDDHPTVAAAAEAAELPVHFADEADPKFRRFYLAAGVRQLTDIYAAGVATMRQERKKQDWVAELLNRIHASYLPVAVAKLVALEDPGLAPDTEQMRRELATITSIVLSDAIERSYRIGRSEIRVAVDHAKVDDRIALAGVVRRSDAVSRLAQAVSEFAHPSLVIQRHLADAIYRLLDYHSERQVAAYMASRGIPWKLEVDRDEREEADEVEALGDLLGELYSGRRARNAEGIDLGAQVEREESNGNEQWTAEATGVTVTDPMPAIEEVVLEVLDPVLWSAPGKGSGGGGAGPRAWTPRDPLAREEDRELGRRAEALVYGQELDRVAKLGYPPEHVVWVARENESADHDILSTDDDGEPLYVEVKATRGRHGKFLWPRAEFDRAVMARNRYVIWRVYEGASRHPKARPFRDPVGLLLRAEMRVDLDSLSAEVAPIGEEQQYGPRE